MEAEPLGEPLRVIDTYAHLLPQSDEIAAGRVAGALTDELSRAGELPIRELQTSLAI